MKPQWPFPMIWLAESWVLFGLSLQSTLKPKYLVQLKEAFQDHSTWGMSFRQFLSFYDVMHHYVTSHDSKCPNYPVFDAVVIFEHPKNFKNFRPFYRIFYFSIFAIFVEIEIFAIFSNLMNVFKFTNKSMGSVVPTLKNFKLVDTSGKRFQKCSEKWWQNWHQCDIIFSVVLACDVEYNGDAHFEAEVG